MKTDQEKQKIFQETVGNLRAFLGFGVPKVEEKLGDPTAAQTGNRSSTSPEKTADVNLQTQLNTAQESIKQKDAKITQQQAEIDALKKQIDTQQTTLNSLVEEVKRFGNRSSKPRTEAAPDTDMQKNEKTSFFEDINQEAQKRYDAGEFSSNPFIK